MCTLSNLFRTETDEIKYRPEGTRGTRVYIYMERNVCRGCAQSAAYTLFGTGHGSCSLSLSSTYISREAFRAPQEVWLPRFSDVSTSTAASIYARGSMCTHAVTFLSFSLLHARVCMCINSAPWFTMGRGKV